MVYRGLYSYRQRVRVITLFPNIFTAMITLHFIYNRSTNMNYFIYTSHHFTARENMNSINWPRSQYVWLHSSVGRASHRYRGGHGFESRWSPDFFRLLLSNCLNWKIYCDDHSSLHFSYCCKSFWKKSLTRTSSSLAHLHNVARALSSPSRCF